MAVVNSVCSVCGSGSLETYCYGNHLNRIHSKYVILALTFFIINFFYRKCQFVFLQKFWLRLFFSRNSNSVLRCSACGYGEYRHPISEEELRQYYQSIFHLIRGRKTSLFDLSEKAQSSVVIDERSKAQWDFMCRRISLPESAFMQSLEIGGGGAGLSRLMKTHYPSCNAVVIDPNCVWKDYYKKIDLVQISDSFPNKTIVTASYDIVFLSHVLEHVRDINDFIREIKRILKPGAFFFLEVPLCDEAYWKLDAIDGPHLSFFTLKSLETVLSTGGFALIESYSSSEHGILRALAVTEK